MDILIIGILAAALQAALAVALVWRKQTSRFPCFFAYTLFSILATAVNAAMRRSDTSYFFSSVATELIYGIIALLAIREAYRNGLDDFYARHRWNRAVPRLLLAAVIIIPVWRCFHHPGISGRQLEVCAYSSIYAFYLCVASLEVLVLCTLLYLTWAKQYRWRRYNRAILVGFGLYGFVRLLAVALGMVLHIQSEGIRYLSPGAYVVATVFWLSAFLSEGDEPISRRPPDERLLDRTHEALEESLGDLRAGRLRRRE